MLWPANRARAMGQDLSALIALILLLVSAGCDDPDQHSGRACVVKSGEVLSCTLAGKQGKCAQGAKVCQDGELVCKPLPGAGPPVELCDGKDNDCDGQIDESDPMAKRPCVTNKPGSCATGVWACQQVKDKKTLVCVPDQKKHPTELLCDGKDDDCNGLVDEGQIRDCYTGPAANKNKGSCKQGVRLCAGGKWSGCLGQVLPQVEVCDGRDNDCDGEVDEGAPGTGLGCIARGSSGTCAAGLTACVKGAITCVAAKGPPVEETCNGLDDDCDGLVDEGLSRECFAASADKKNKGSCKAGVRLCVGKTWTKCLGQVLPQDEACDTFDNDCDGQTDEGLPAATIVCSTGAQGSCGAGEMACVQGKMVCKSTAVVAVKEKCNGKDDDCNGKVDDGFNKPCYTGPANTENKGECKAGTWACVDGQQLKCIGQVLPRTETCGDDRDRDCNGKVDDTATACAKQCKPVNMKPYLMKGRSTGIDPPTATAPDITRLHCDKRSTGLRMSFGESLHNGWVVCESDPAADPLNLQPFVDGHGYLDIKYKINAIPSPQKTTLRGGLNLWISSPCNNNRIYLPLIAKYKSKSVGEYQERVHINDNKFKPFIQSSHVCTDAGVPDGGAIDGGLAIPPASMFSKAKLQLIHEWLDWPTEEGSVDLLELTYYPSNCLCALDTHCDQAKGFYCDKQVLLAASFCPFAVNCAGVCKLKQVVCP